MRRFTPFVLILAFVCASIPAPARATSTAQEIQMGKDYDRQVTSQNTVVTDPLENAWANGIAQKLWTQVARKDVPYNLKILEAGEVNAFSTVGGYVYLDEGLLDFVQSDDELAGVIGHETGHIERRHVVTLNNRTTILNILFGIGSLFSPFVYRFGQLAEAGIVARMQRDDELQADAYGLLLMSRAGYDPDAMVTFMRHLEATHREHSSLVDKYFADHPGEPVRIGRLLASTQLDTKKRTADQLLVQAQHDQDEARYSSANMKYAAVLKLDPNNPVALLHEGEMQLALGQPNKGEQTLAQAATAGPVETRVVALNETSALHEGQSRFTYIRPDVGPIQQQVADGQTFETQEAASLAARRKAAQDQIKAITGRLQSLAAEAPNLSNVQARPGGRLAQVVVDLNAMSRAINAAVEKSTEVIGGVGSLEKNKEGGILKEDRDIYADLAAPLGLDPIPPQSLSTLPYYPRMLAELRATDADSIHAIDAARGALALLDGGIGDADRALRQLMHSQLDYSGDISQVDSRAVQPVMQAALESLDKAASAAQQAWQTYNMARARQLETRITMLGLGYPQNRYQTLQYAIDERWNGLSLDSASLVRDGLSPGEMAAAAIVAADTNATTEAIVQQAKAERTSIVDVARERGVRALSLEIFLGLIYLDYVDDPEKEAHASG
ncbi:MAG TPA: M48 family metalloprotease [Candidatus Binatia bacterium]|nr:M48 family metalloprotease [Candidatus Binatia bacterium]